MKKNYFSEWLIMLALLPFATQAQQKLAKELVIVNGGSSDVSTYNPSTNNYQSVGSISSTSTQDVAIYGNYAYVAAVDSIVMFDLVGQTRIAALCEGVTDIEVYNDKLIVAKGFGASSDYVEIRNAFTLDIDTAFNAVNDECSSIALLNDTAYVTIPGAWGTSIGRVGIIDLKTNDVLRIDTLGTDGEGVGNVFVSNGKIHTVSAHGWGAIDYSVHTFDPATSSWTVFNGIGSVNGYSGAMNINDSLWLSINDTTKIIDISNMNIINANFTTKVLSTLVYDDVNDQFYGTLQSFVNNGQAYIFNPTGTVVDSFAIGVAAEAIAMAYNYIPLANDDKAIVIRDEAYEFNNQQNDTDVEPGHLMFNIIVQPQNGTATNVFGDHVLYQANQGFVGIDSLQYSVTDSWGDSATAWTFINVIDDLNTTIVTFEDFGLSTDEFYNGADQWGGFVANGALFPNNYNPAWGSWSGFSYSTFGDTLTPGFGNQYSSIAGAGMNSSAFGIANGTTGEMFVNSSLGQSLAGVYITNSTYAALSMKDGDAFAKQFGGVSGDDPDYFKVVFYGVDNTNSITDSVEFYLADYRDADNSNDYIVSDWQYVDFSGLGTVKSVRYRLESTDNGAWGMNTPAYFCLDNLNDFPASTNEVVSVSDWKVFPNPMMNQLNIFNGNNIDQDVEIKIYNLKGMLVKNIQIWGSSTQIDVSDLASGMYSITIDYGNSLEVHKIVKQ